MSPLKLKYISLFSFAIFAITFIYFIGQAKEALKLELTASSQRVAELNAAAQIYDFLKTEIKVNSTEMVLSKESAARLTDIFNNKISEILKNHLKNKKDTETLAKLKTALINLENKQPVDRLFIDYWLKNSLFTEIVSQASGYQQSQENTAAAEIIVNPRWSTLLLVMTISLAVWSFSFGFQLGQNRQKTNLC